LIIEFCNRHIDMETGKVGDVWQPPPPREDPVMAALKEIMDRLEKLEKPNGKETPKPKS
jgi:hypothetical protein